ncbi:16S rRNA (cytosine(1402)-N(4))-methyltransferase RsmH [Campylobacter sputorum]|uniref:16S rRNA (cytosine(1402)-N(4))-methyltransferase RsmH n=1 Tax=Campylobacter sputorum TaxID=206 RepID=UPI00053BF7A3|nr:16S rRNA (cytosine(1402)-N(4))-methyltransferase RsmH [Campylobacter sputorum]
MKIPHIPVLKDEILSFFSNIKNGIILDCTLGYGGHSEALLKTCKDIKIIACDRDIEAINFSLNRLEPYKHRVDIHKDTYSNILNYIKQDDIHNIKGILADIGVSSLQLDKNSRGFGLNSDVLDMRMDSDLSISAYDVINSYSFENLSDILYKFGELNNARKIAQAIINQRKISNITSPKHLTNLVNKFKIKGRNIDTAILVFQAIRIEVNKELDELENLLNNIEKSNINECFLAIITFHSLEDRIVKNKFKQWSKSCICPEFALKCECGNNHNIGYLLNKKPIVASQNELKENSRSSSAKLRVFYINRGKNERQK